MRRAFRQQSSVPLFVSLLLSGALAAGCSVQAQEERPVFDTIPQPPDVQLGPLFTAVQAANLYPDQKTFADAVPKSDPELILSDWQMQKMQRNFDLKRFVATNFSMPATGDVYTSPKGQSLRAHINGLWPVLTRSDKVDNQWGSLLPLPYPYVVPGGRFREVYYWDSYFTMLGLAESGRWERVQDMVDNFAYQLDTYGHIPNGNRSYYLSRSQPPFFSMMVDLLAQHGGDKIYGQYRPQLEKEYRYWMTGVDDEALRPGSATQRVVKLRDGTILNRYWDDRDVPRTESWREDTITARQAAGPDRAQLYRDLRAGAASGWDFSSRWFDKPDDLSTIRTTQILPADLNALMFHLEKTLARAYKTENNAAASQRFEQLAERRKTAIGHYLWDEKQGWYADYDWQRSRVRPQLTAAALFPLYLQAATGERATRTASAVKKHLLAEGGLLTTTVTSGQQWDAPNGWAPLQWVAVVGLNHYGQEPLAKEIGLRFLNSVQTTYEKDHKLVEKYVVKGVSLTHGGEYPLQDGFGWTNAVTLKLMDLYCPKGTICNNVGDLNSKKEP